MIAIGLLNTGCSNKNSSSTFDIMAMQKIIVQKNNEWAKAITSGDSAAMVNHYMVDAKISPPNSDAVVSRPYIAAFISQIMKYRIKEYQEVTTDLYGNEDNVVEEGKYYIGDGKGKTLDQGKYIAIWRKVEGDWKIYSDIWNTSMPAEATK